jgi:curved DNA-binding protein CbpA
MSHERDAYHVLQVIRAADQDVIRAAYRALAKRYHPDGHAPDAARMAEINAAFEQLRTPERRAEYDRTHRHLVGVGPGASEHHPGGGLARRAAAARAERESSPVIDFGRYEGWPITEVARRDPDYLRWLSRHSTGVRYRDAIADTLGEPELGRRSSEVR